MSGRAFLAGLQLVDPHDVDSGTHTVSDRSPRPVTAVLGPIATGDG